MQRCDAVVQMWLGVLLHALLICVLSAGRSPPQHRRRQFNMAARLIAELCGFDAFLCHVQTLQTCRWQLRRRSGQLHLRVLHPATP